MHIAKHIGYSSRLLTVIITAGMFLFLQFGTEAQEEPDIRSLLNLINSGNEQLLQKKLPQLLESYPNHPGLLYVQALTTNDADEAVSYYQTIIAETPDSEWADDALYKLYEYYYAIGAYNVASQQITELKKRYPSSSYIKRITDQSAVEKESKSSIVDATSKQIVNYSVQVGAFSSSAAAQVKLRDMKALGYSCEHRSKISGASEGREGKKMYTVWIGEFNTFDQAVSFVKKLKQRHNIDAIVVRR